MRSDAGWDWIAVIVKMIPNGVPGVEPKGVGVPLEACRITCACPRNEPNVAKAETRPFASEVETMLLSVTEAGGCQTTVAFGTALPELSCSFATSWAGSLVLGGPVWLFPLIMSSVATAPGCDGVPAGAPPTDRLKVA